MQGKQRGRAGSIYRNTGTGKIKEKWDTIGDDSLCSTCADIGIYGKIHLSNPIRIIMTTNSNKYPCIGPSQLSNVTGILCAGINALQQ